MNRLTTLISLSKKAFGAYKRQILVLAGLGFLNGLLGGIGINAIIPLLSFVVGDGDRGTDIISKTLAQMFSFVGLTFNLKNLLFLIISLFLLKAGVMLLCNYIRIRIRAGYTEEMRSKLFQKSLQARWSYLLRQKIGYLDTVLVREIDAGASLLNEIGNSIIVGTSLLIYLLIAFNISARIALLALALGAILFLFFKPLIFRTRLLAKERGRTWKSIAHHINEHVLGLKTVKTMSAEQAVSKASQQYFSALKELLIKTAMFKDIPVVLMQPISLIFICLVFGFSYKLGSFQFAAFLAIIYLIQKVFNYFQGAQNALHNINDTLPHLQNVVNYQTEIEKEKESDEGRADFHFKQGLAFEKVKFAYSPLKTVLEEVSFKVKKGEMVGIIGPSGSGKTTIVDLLLRLFQPQEGRILIDNKNINTIKLADWRGSIGYVSQDIFLLNSTVEENIKFYQPQISHTDVERAAKLANIFDFVQNQPDGFQTLVGERGVRLSAGQRQRIILARVLVRNPQILVLDEATSALDNESEALIQKAIKDLKGKTTVLMIAHRLSSVLFCDKLLVLDKGKIIEQGRPADLLAEKKSYFYKAYNISNKQPGKSGLVF